MIAGAIGLSVSIPILLLGIDTERQSLSTLHEAQAIQILDTCLEKGLFSIKENSGYEGLETLAFAGGNCVVTVLALDGIVHLYATSTVADIVKKAQIELISTNPIVMRSRE